MAKKIKTTLGGDRLGSGNQQKIEMHNYYRSNHNLSCSRVSSMAPGVLYPMYINVGLTGDTWDFDLNAFMRTLPTEGPLFGAFKLQVDVFSADMRLYQAILHNNTTEIGFDMDQVILPKIELTGAVNYNKETNKYDKQHSKTSLVNYIGISGVGTLAGKTNGIVKRKFNALPILAYYDIFKNYYANKQEENAYVINSYIQPTPLEKTSIITNVAVCTSEDLNTCTIVEDYSFFAIRNLNYLRIQGTNLTYVDENNIKKPNISITNRRGNIINRFDVISLLDNLLVLRLKEEYNASGGDDATLTVTTNKDYKTTISKTEVKLQPFPLKNIDIMRKELLTMWDLGEEYIIDNQNSILPYSVLTGTSTITENNIEREVSVNYSPMQGLVVKCYQSDWFNNWLDSEYITKIAQKSNVNVSNGSFSIDALNFAKKLYDHYNRIAVTGGTYDDWQKAAYGMVRYGKAEKPIYHGGMSSEVIFDEVVSTSQTTNADGAINPLGSLGGRGALKTQKGGHVIVKCNEQCIIMIMVSLTPRISQTQGNAWYCTELDNMNDLHQPDFDRIGFQDLLVEQMAWWDAKYITTQGLWSRTSAGKQPAWIQYQTDVDKAFGDMAEEDGYGFMILNRNYDVDEATGRVKDVTTYIDPSKFNYAFAVSSLTAQNFWGFFNLGIKVRRLMSAKQMPNV